MTSLRVFPGALHRALPLILLCFALLGERTAVAQIPGVPVYPEPDAGSQWQRYTLALTDSLLRNWITAAERGEHEVLARLFTDSALVLHPGGNVGVGRAAVEELFSRLPQRSGYRAKTSGARASFRLAHTSGRLRFEEGGAETTQTFTVLFEQHHDHWLVRALAFAPAGDVLAQAAMPRDALTSRERRIEPPQHSLVRLTLEPIFARELQLQERPGTPWSAFGAGVGLEINRALELRGFGWQMPSTPGGDVLASYGGEARFYTMEHWRLRPFFAVGSSKFNGAGAPDTSWIPVVGGGLSVRLLSHADLQISVRDYLVSSPDGIDAGHWMREKREQRPVVSAGLSLALGRRRPWRDAEPSAEYRAYQAAHAGDVLAVLSEWEQALQSMRPSVMDRLYGSGATLYTSEGAHGSSEAIVQVLRQALEGAPSSVRNLRVSGGLAYVDVSFASGAGEQRLMTILHQEEGRWVIGAQLLR